MRLFGKFDAAKVAFRASLVVLIFGYGVAVGKYEIFPHDQIRYAKESLALVIAERGTLTRTRPTQFIAESRYEGSGVTVHDEGRAFPGYTLLNSFFDGGPELRLVDMSGTPVNRWPVRAFEIWENLEHVQPPEERPATEWNFGSNGALLLPDGSVVFNLFGLVKMDRCGEVVWALPKVTHHSLEPAADGGFWTGGWRYVSDRTEHPPLAVPYIIDEIMKISEDGVVVKELAILDLLFENGLRPLLFANNREFDPNAELDVVHVNDVEELSASFASSYPLFEAGDLLVSLRQPNMVFVVDPETEVIKWYRIGPWIQQHDADFHPDGTITVFDNQFDGTETGSVLGGSRIVEVNPANGETDVLYGGRPDQFMYTATMGDHQMLPNGDILITESNAGRVLEVDSAGRIVWEFINRHSDEEVLRISKALRYDPDYFLPGALTCDGGSYVD